MVKSNHSAEFWRGAVAGLDRGATTGYGRDLLAEYRTLLAEAEAREAGEPTAAEVIRRLREALECIARYGDVFAYRLSERNPAEAVREALALAAEWEGRNGS